MKLQKIISAALITLVSIIGLTVAVSAEKYVVGSSRPSSQNVEKSPQATQKNPDQDTLVIKARLLEIPGTFPPNDLYNYVYIMKYRVLSVEKGSFDNREILVGHYNPRIARDKVSGDMDTLVNGNVQSFDIGDKHRLVLVKPLIEVWDGAVEDDYFDSNEDKYYALTTDKAE
ncbi:MAG: hypothetical protein ACOC41_09020 [Chitinivibrionales bacterium]